MPARLCTAVACLIALLALAACGGDDGPSESDFFAEADEICTEAARDRIETQAVVVDGKAETLAQLKAQAKIRESTLEELRALDPPADIKDAWDEYLAAREEVIALAEQEIKLVGQDTSPEDPAYQRLLTQFEAAGKKQDQALADTDSEACANKLPDDQREAAVEQATFFETEPVDDCTDYMTDKAIDELFGGLEACQKAQKTPPPEGFTKSVEVQEVTGIAGVSASIDAALTGGIGDGQEVTYSMLYEDGAWKTNAVFLQPE